jgi:hypothetical protein
MTRAKKVRTATRKCATCGAPFTWTSRNPKRRFCDPTCKARWWRASNNDRDTTIDAGTTKPTANTERPPTGSTAEAGTANAVTHPYDPYVSGYRTDQSPNRRPKLPELPRTGRHHQPARHTHRRVRQHAVTNTN